MSKLVTKTVHKRGAIGKLFKWSFIIFNVWAGIGLIRVMFMRGSDVLNREASLETAGALAGSVAAIGTILVFWFCGAAVLGVLTYATRGAKISITETVND